MEHVDAGGEVLIREMHDMAARPAVAFFNQADPTAQNVVEFQGVTGSTI
jgi:hypothetical protein